MSISSRLLRAATRLLVPSVLLAAAPARAEAQLDCGYNSLEFYMANPCRLAGFDFFDFFLISSAGASGPTEALAPDILGTDVFLDPFSYIDPVDGGRIFGFDLEGFQVSASAEGGDLGEGTASALALFGFQAVSSSGAGRIAGAGADLRIGGDTGTPGRTELYQGAFAGVLDLVTSEPCLARFLENFGPGSKTASPRRNCGQPGPNGIVAVYGIEADVSRSASPRALGGVSLAVVTTVGFRSVPEPTTVALLGGGLLALASVARRRRSA